MGKFYLKDLIFSVLEKWKLYILVGCLGLVLLGVFKFYTTEKTRKGNEELIAAGLEEEVITSDAYQSALDALVKKEQEIQDLEEKITKRNVDITDYRTTITNARDKNTEYKESLKLLADEKEEVSRKLAELQAYMEDTVLLNIDATAKPVARRDFQVIYDGEGTEALFRDPVDEIVAAYTKQITLIGAGSGLAEKYEVPEKYFDELFSVTYDAESNMVFAEAYGVDEQMAKDVLDAVCGIMESRIPEMSERYHAHTLNTVSEDYREVVDEALADTQSNRYKTVNSYKSQIASYDAQILNVNTGIDNNNSLITAAEQQIKDAQKSIEASQKEVKMIRRVIIQDALEEKVAAKAPSVMRSLKDGVKLGIIGAIVLAVLAAGCFAVLYFLDGKLHTDCDLSVYQLPVLAVLNRPLKKNGFIDKWIYQMRNKDFATANEEILKTGAVSLGKLIGEDKRIAVLSSLDRAAASEMAGELKALIPGVEFVPVAASFRSAASAEELSGVDSAILYEKREASALSDIEAELGQLALLEKRVIGSIIS